MPTREYVECRNGGYYVASTRVSLASIVHQFGQGRLRRRFWGAFRRLGRWRTFMGL